MSGRLRLVVLTELIAPYRIPVFNALARHQGIDPHVIFFSENDPTLRQWQVYKEEIEFSHEVLPSWRRRIGKHNVLLNRGLEAALRRSAPDAIVCGGYTYLAAWQSLWWARRKRVPFVLWSESTAMDLRRGNASIEFLKMKFMRACDAFVVPGKSSLDYVRRFTVPEEMIFQAPNAVDSGWFARTVAGVRRNAAKHREELHLPSRFFLFVGRLVPEKGIFDLLDAYGKLPPAVRSEVGLVLAGDGVARAEVARRAATLDPGSVRIAGFLQREELARYYALAEAMVFPSHSDPWGLVVNEAMACGLPIIATAAAGCTADLVEDRWNGRVVPPGDPQHLASAMLELAANAEMRRGMGQHSRERILGYSPEKCAAGIAQAACGVAHG